MTTDICQPRDIIKGRWVIKEKIGSGGYGQIYRAEHRLGLLEDVAVKVGAWSGDNEVAKQALNVEAHVLRLLKGHKHFCELFEYSSTPTFAYIVMSSCGKTLADLRRGTTEGYFSVSTAFRVSIQILKSIDDIHGVGFLHRDIKPSNFMMGKGKNNKTLYMLDFGLARKYMTSSGTIREARPYAGFRGTVRYASLQTHANQEMSRRDDLWSMFYMLVEFLQGQLPWSRYKDKEEVGRIKKQFTVQSIQSDNITADVRGALKEFWDHLTTLTYESKPDYILLKNSMTKVLTERKCQPEDFFDWENSIFNIENIAKKLKSFGKSAGSTKFSKSQQHLSEKFEFNDGELWNEPGHGNEVTAQSANADETYVKLSGGAKAKSTH